MDSYIIVRGNGQRTLKVMARINGVISADTLRSAFQLEQDVPIGLFRDDIALECSRGHDGLVFQLQNKWKGAEFELYWDEERRSPLVTPIEQDIGSKRKRVEDVLSEEKKNSYWELYKHYLFYTKLDEKMKAAASLLDDHHLVLCLHEIPKLQEIRRELIQLFAEQDEFLREYNGDADFKENYLSILQKNISTKEKELKFEASKIIMEFIDYKEETFLTKVEYYNWQHDFCIMRSAKQIYYATPETEFCDRGTNYIMLGFRPPEYSNCIIEGVISGSINAHYLCGVPGAFPGMSGGPILEKLNNGGGRLLGICSGAQDTRIGINSSFAEALNPLSDAQTNLPYVLIIPALRFRFGLPKSTKSYELIKTLEELHLSRLSNAISNDSEDKTTQTDN